MDFDSILAAVCRDHGVPAHVVLGRCRWRTAVAARHDLWTRLNFAGHTDSEIARRTGFDRATIASALDTPRRAA